MKEWKTVPDNQVSHIWRKSAGDDCEENQPEIQVTPDWYEENGTPICMCGRDMEYSHTEVKLL